MLAPSAAVDPSSTDILAVANQPYLWVAAVGVLLVIGAQSVIYFRAARKAGPDAGLTRQESTTAYLAGAIASIGPSLAVCLAIVQMVFSDLQPRLLIIGLSVGVVVVFALTPLFPVVAYFATALAVVFTVLMAVLLPGKHNREPAEEAQTEDIS